VGLTRELPARKMLSEILSVAIAKIRIPCIITTRKEEFLIQQLMEEIRETVSFKVKLTIL
jgi:hypothetical protein